MDYIRKHEDETKSAGHHIDDLIQSRQYFLIRASALVDNEKVQWKRKFNNPGELTLSEDKIEIEIEGCFDRRMRTEANIPGKAKVDHASLSMTVANNQIIVFVEFPFLNLKLRGIECIQQPPTTLNYMTSFLITVFKGIAKVYRLETEYKFYWRI